MKTKYKIYIAKFILIFLSIFIHKKKFVKKINNINWNFDLDEGIDLNLFLFRKFEYDIINTSKKLNLKNDSTIIDIGANSGIQTLQFAKYHKKCKIYSIEPTDFAFSRLKKNILINKKLSKSINVSQVFITNKKLKPNKVYSSWNLKSKAVHKNHFGTSKSTFNAKTQTLDNFVSINKIKNISLIKLDVDGNEYYVLKSGKLLLSKKKIPIIMEFAPYLYKENNYSLDDMIKLIKSFNYSFFELISLKKINDIYDFAFNIPHGASKNILIK